MVKFVLWVLLIFSIVSWAIIFVKFRMVRKAKWEDESFLELFWEGEDFKTLHIACKEYKYSPIGQIFSTGYLEFTRMRKLHSYYDPQGSQESSSGESVPQQQAIMDNLRRSLRKATIDQANRLERAVSFLATTGNTAPFIGLFGTVWGIMDAFRGIGLKGSANLAVVAPGISEALIATAAGLAAAIPAVIAFNYFNQKISGLRAEMDIFTSEFLSTVERQFYKTQIVARKSS